MAENKTQDFFGKLGEVRPENILLLGLLAVIGISAAITIIHSLMWIFSDWIINFQLDHPIHNLEMQRHFLKHIATSFMTIELFRVNLHFLQRRTDLILSLIEISTVFFILKLMLTPFVHEGEGAANVQEYVLIYLFATIILSITYFVYRKKLKSYGEGLNYESMNNI
ncbi:MAG: hypothetical protein ACE5K4_09285 [Candidatus Hydrothermarchaeota archaeon]